MVFKPVVPQSGYLPMQVPFFFFPYGTQPQLMASNEMTVPYTSLAVNYPNQCGATMYRPDYNGAMFPVNIAPSPSRFSFFLDIRFKPHPVNSYLW